MYLLSKYIQDVKLFDIMINEIYKELYMLNL